MRENPPGEDAGHVEEEAQAGADCDAVPRRVRVNILHIRNKVCTSTTAVDVQSTLQGWWGLVEVGGGWKGLEINDLEAIKALSVYP